MHGYDLRIENLKIELIRLLSFLKAIVKSELNIFLQLRFACNTCLSDRFGNTLLCR